MKIVGQMEFDFHGVTKGYENNVKEVKVVFNGSQGPVSGEY